MDNPFNQLYNKLENIESLLATLSNYKDTPLPLPEILEKPVTTQELCNYFRVSEPTILRWRKKGRIPCIMIGTAVRFNLSDVLKSLAK